MVGEPSSAAHGEQSVKRGALFRGEVEDPKELE